MKKKLQEMLELEDVNKFTLYSIDGESILEDPDNSPYKALDTTSIMILFDKLDNADEAEFIFEKIRIYLRKVQVGYVLVVMGLYAPASLVRLYIDVMMPDLNKIKKPSGLSRFFKKK